MEHNYSVEMEVEVEDSAEDDGLPNIDRETRRARPDFLTGPGLKKTKLNGPDVVVPGSNVTYTDAVAFAYRDVLLQRQVALGEVKFVEVVRKVRGLYPGAWEGQPESSCVHLMKTAYKKAGKKFKEEEELLGQSGNTGRQSELQKTMREILALDKSAKTRTHGGGKKKKGKPSVVDALVMASYQARREQGRRPTVEEGAEGEEVVNAASVEEDEVEVKEQEPKQEPKTPLALHRPIVDPSQREQFEKGNQIRDASLEMMRNQRKGHPRALNLFANMASKTSDEQKNIQAEMQSERMKFEIKMEERKQAREDMKEKKYKEEKEEKERRERKEKEEKEEKERRQEEKEKLDREERRELERERRMFMQQQQQQQQQASLVTTALLHKMMGGPLQPDIGPTATASVEIQLVNQDCDEIDISQKVEKSSFESFIRELQTYAKVEEHEGLVVQGAGGRLTRITSLNFLPDGDVLNLSVIQKNGKTYLKLASGEI